MIFRNGYKVGYPEAILAFIIFKKMIIITISSWGGNALVEFGIYAWNRFTAFGVNFLYWRINVNITKNDKSFYQKVRDNYRALEIDKAQKGEC